MDETLAWDVVPDRSGTHCIMVPYDACFGSVDGGDVNERAIRDGLSAADRSVTHDKQCRFMVQVLLLLNKQMDIV